MTDLDIYMTRLKLLILMTKSQLESYPLGKYRKQALLKNADYIAQESMKWFGKFSVSHGGGQHREVHVDYFLYQRINLLALMIKAVAESLPVGNFRTKAIEDNIDYICEALGFDPRNCQLQFLKVA